jgi:hypothetical protein
VAVVVLPRGEVPPEQWDAFVMADPSGWFFHTSRWIDYAQAYSPEAVDLSFAAVDYHGEVRGVQPLLWDNASREYVCGGQLTPVGLCRGEEAALRMALINTQIAVDVTGRPRTFTFRPSSAAYQAPPALPPTLRFLQWDTHVVDLRVPEDVLWRRLRRSYKSLINRWTRGGGITHSWDRLNSDRGVYVYGASAGDPDGGIGAKGRMREAQALHLQSAGRATRGQQTWDLMGQWAREGDALLAVAYDGLVAVGYAYAIRWRDWAYYASGASIVDDVQHALLWETMRALRADGHTRWFEVGWGPRPGDDEKARGVAFFKSGFGGEPWHVAAAVRDEGGV